MLDLLLLVLYIKFALTYVLLIFLLSDALGGWRMVMAWSCISIVHRHFWHSGNPGRLLHYFFHFRVSISFFLLAFFNYYYLEHFLLHTLFHASLVISSLNYWHISHLFIWVWWYGLILSLIRIIVLLVEKWNHFPLHVSCEYLSIPKLISCSVLKLLK